MLTPEQRKAQSERLLRIRGVSCNPHLPVIESEEEVTLRSEEEVLHRLVALWAAAGTAFSEGNNHFRDYIRHRKYEVWLSSHEREFIFSDHRSERDLAQFSWQFECLYFVAWCAGLIDRIEIPGHESSAEPIVHLYPGEMEPPDKLAYAITIRNKSEIMDWADLLYRLHWATRERERDDRLYVPDVNSAIVSEWHRAVNWMIRYREEDDWDLVATDT